MSMQNTPASERVHIAFFGRRNAGKSSLINAVTGQELSVVSDVAGTTTDPVYKTMELLPVGPVVLIDTPGYDDEGDLGELRVKKTRQVLNRTDCGILVVDATEGAGKWEAEFSAMFEERKIPYVTVYNKSDELSAEKPNGMSSDVTVAENIGTVSDAHTPFYVSAKTGAGIHELKERIGALLHTEEEKRRLIGDKIAPGDVAVLVVPIDEAAPKGRLILPQQQTIRDILDAEGMPLVVKDTGLPEAFSALANPPAMVITDSQVFGKVAKQVPAEVPLTSFSILMARYKGFLSTAVEGVRTLETLQDGDKVLISEGCTHHRQCGDIGTVKLPAMIRKFTGKEPEFVFTSGKDFPEDLNGIRLVIHCGGCMLTERELSYRKKTAEDERVPFTNYGIALAHMNGILKRSVAMFPEVAELLR
ncbi:MAG: [FeFe] hydrogenase H-cluster maturation GTPase HydF [Lachnospiraceae bacterium]|nr:[FeFe] hydrogenase H-cluster maturation GTPase HydF [Lachnospiraceae bacterium]